MSATPEAPQGEFLPIPTAIAHPRSLRLAQRKLLDLHAPFSDIAADVSGHDPQDIAMMQQLIERLTDTIAQATKKKGLLHG